MLWPANNPQLESQTTEQKHSKQNKETLSSDGRICSGHCRSWKPWSQYDKKSNGKNGYDSRCKACISRAKKSYKIKEKKRYAETAMLQSKIIGTADQEKIEHFAKIISASIMFLIDEGIIK